MKLKRAKELKPILQKIGNVNLIIVKDQNIVEDIMEIMADDFAENNKESTIYSFYREEKAFFRDNIKEIKYQKDWNLLLIDASIDLQWNIDYKKIKERIAFLKNFSNETNTSILVFSTIRDDKSISFFDYVYTVLTGLSKYHFYKVDKKKLTALLLPDSPSLPY